MKKYILIFMLFPLALFSQDSIKVSLNEARNIVKSNEQRIQCEDKVLELDSQITRLETVIDAKDTKITDLYNIQNLHKDNFNTLSDSNDILIGENKQLQRSLKREKLKLIVVVTGAVLIEILTIKLMYNGK